MEAKKFTQQEAEEQCPAGKECSYAEVGACTLADLSGEEPPVCSLLRDWFNNFKNGSEENLNS